MDTIRANHGRSGILGRPVAPMCPGTNSVMKTWRWLCLVVALAFLVPAASAHAAGENDGRAAGAPGSPPENRNGHALNLVDDEGADPSGVGDSAAALTRVFALTAPAVVHVPCGTYLLSGAQSFTTKTAISLIGEDRGCVTFKFPPSTVLKGDVFEWRGNPNYPEFSVEGITIDLANTTAPALHFAIGTIQTIPAIRRNRIINGPEHMFLIGVNWQGRGFTFEDNYLHLTAPTPSASNGGIIVISGPIGSTKGIIKNNILVNGGMEINASDTIIDGNICNNWGLQGSCLTTEVNPAFSFHVTVTNNIAYGNDGGGSMECMELWARQSVIANNQVYNCPGNGFGIGGRDSVVTGNLVVGAGASTHAGVGFVLLYESAAANGNGSFFNGNTAIDGGAGTQTYGFADASSGNSSECRASTQICSAIFGFNRFSGTLGAMLIRTEGDAYAGNGLMIQGGISSGSPDAQALSGTSPEIIPSTMVPGLTLTFVPGFTNTGPATLTAPTAAVARPADFFSRPPRTTGTLAVKKIVAGAVIPLTGGELTARIPATLIYDGTQWTLPGPHQK